MLLVTTHITSRDQNKISNTKGNSTCSWRAARALLSFLEVSASYSCRARATARLISFSLATICSHSSSSSESIGDSEVAVRGMRQSHGGSTARRAAGAGKAVAVRWPALAQFRLAEGGQGRRQAGRGWARAEAVQGRAVASAGVGAVQAGWGEVWRRVGDEAGWR